MEDEVHPSRTSAIITGFIERSYFIERPSRAEGNDYLSSEVKVSQNFPYQLLMKISSSEPRDLLQSEQTCLTFFKFGTTLFFTALAISLNFKLKTSSDSGNNLDDQNRISKLSNAVSLILAIMSLFVLLLSCFNYFSSIRRYANRRIHTKFYSTATVICMTTIMFVLMGMSIILVVESYIENT